MALREEFENTGNWLFRWRSYLPLIVIGRFLLTLREYEYPDHSERLDHIWEVVCLIVSFFGLGIRIFTIGHTPKGSGRNTKHQVAETLNTTGPYFVVRNPLYLGNFFAALGIALFAHLWWLTLIYLLGHGASRRMRLIDASSQPRGPGLMAVAYQLLTPTLAQCYPGCERIGLILIWGAP